MTESNAPRNSNVFEQRPWQHVGANDLAEAALVPTMLNFEEQAYYLWLTRDWAEGAGAIVDLGSFAGGSAACLAEGVRQSGRHQAVHGYDKFEVGDYDVFQERYRRYVARPPASDCGLQPPGLPACLGSDLLPVARFLLKPWQDGVILHKGRIEKTGWKGDAIELLVMDASKTAATMDQMSATFFPHLIPGRSIVVQQDFLWWQQPWIAVQMAHLEAYFEPVAYIPNHSVSFRCIRQVPSDLLARLHIENLTDGEYVDALRDMKQRLKAFPVDRYMRRLIAAVRANPASRKAFQFSRKP